MIAPGWSRGLAAAVLTGLALAGCAASEPRPALMAQSETGSYGYAETRLAEGRYEIVYESPSMSVSLDDSQREARLEAERRRAYDFALWHAAEMAQAQGFAAFTVEQDRRDAHVSVRTDRYNRLWPGFYGPLYGRPYPLWGLYDDDCCWPSAYRYQRWASARITVDLTVRFFEQQPADADGEVLDAADTLTRLRARYGTPTYP